MTQKKEEFVVRYTNKDIIEKLEHMDVKLDNVHTMARVTNGKVKMHTKLLWAIGGFMAMLVTFILTNYHLGG